MSDAALTHLRAHRAASLLADGIPYSIRFISDPRGRLVFPADGAVLHAEETTLFVPEEAPADEPDLQLMLAVTELPASDASCDRWRVYHGEPRTNLWAVAVIEGARFEGEVIEHDAIAIPNPLTPVEPRLCRKLNADRAKLALVCQLVTGLAPADPVAVGVDPEGIDIRARFGILRLPFRAAAEDPERLIDQLLSGDAP